MSGITAIPLVAGYTQTATGIRYKRSPLLLGEMMNRFVPLAVYALLLPSSAWSADDEKPEPGFNEETFAGLELRNIGPAFMAGRIADIAIDPLDQSTWYVGVGSGGVWKTETAGTTWEAIFDGEDAYSIGCITIDPDNSNTIRVGTGENVSGRHVAYGAGVYRSRDGGKHWENVGLADSQHIVMISIDPRESNIVFVAAQGPLRSGGGDRGLYTSRWMGDSRGKKSWATDWATVKSTTGTRASPKCTSIRAIPM